MALCTPSMGGALFVPEHGTYLQLQPVLIPYIGGALFVLCREKISFAIKSLRVFFFDRFLTTRLPVF